MKKNTHKLNSEIRFPLVRLVGRETMQILSSYEANKIAEDEDKDLILINEEGNPPVVRIENYNKFLYDIEKREKDIKKKNPDIKEIQLSVNIGEHDFNTKLRKAIEFLENNHKLKCVLLLKGRMKAKPSSGEIVMIKFLDALIEKGLPESLPKLEGSKWISIVKPKKKNP